ncbi:MAG: hypothetical protein IPF92_04300 [Myxococcales bacterium]|nr:hypothetical protein [Myxococcales bacterium]
MTDSPDAAEASAAPPLAAGRGGAAGPAPGGRLRRLLDDGPTLLAFLCLATVGVFVFWPSLACPLWLDDYIHRAMVNHVYPSPRGPLDLYDFVSERDRGVLMTRGILPWWTNPRLEIRFLRPLSSALLYGDHSLFGEHPLVMHLHSFAWWLAAVFGARGLFRRFFIPRIALLATVVFALAPCHAIPLAWLANREALVSLAFGLFALGHYEDFRASRSLARGAAAAALFALSMAGGEYGLLLAGYVVTAEVFAREATPSPSYAGRALGVLPWLAPTAAYLAIRHHFHYGAAGSGFYSDPTQAFGEFMSHAPRRLASLLLDAWLSLDGNGLRALGGWQVGLLFLVALALLAAPVHGAIARLDARAAGHATAMLAGSVLGLAPALAVSTSPRLLAAGMLGVASTVAIVLNDAWFAPPAPEGALESAHAPRGALTASVAYALGFLHLIHAPITSWVVGKEIGFGARLFASHARSLGKRAGAVDAQTPSEVAVQLVRAPNAALFMPFALNPRAEPPRRWRVLARAPHVLAMREGPRTLVLTAPRDVSLFTTEDGDVFGAAPMSLGAVLRVEDMRIEILQVGAEGPERARFTFDRDLDAEGMVWATETGRGYPSITPPEEGFGAPFDP